MGRHADSARERIIDAAERVVIEFGARHLTFDAVAEKAGVSRGGLLYHFPDKVALLKAMLDRLIGRAKEGRARKRADLPDGTGREMVAYVLWSLQEEQTAVQAVAAALLASGAHDPSLLGPLKEEYRRFLDDLTREGLRFERAAVISLAIDGLRLLELLSMSPFDEDERGRIVKELKGLAGEEDGGNKSRG